MNILENPDYYSISTVYVTKKMSITKEDIYDIIRNSRKWHVPKINVFRYNDVEYVGLESRRLDYERDKNSGTNPIEHNIESYGKRSNSVNVHI